MEPVKRLQAIALPRGVLWVMVAGFATIISLLLGAGYVGIRAMRSIENSATRLVDEQRQVTTLIDRIQRLEADLTTIFYSLASSTGEHDRSALERRVSALETQVEEVARLGASTRERQIWKQAHSAAIAFIREVRMLLEGSTATAPSPSFFRKHEQFLDEIARLVAADYADSAAQEAATIQRSSDRISQSFVLLWAAVSLSAIGAGVTTGVANAVFRRMEWQRSELAALSRHVIESQESTARRFSRELHDEFGQILSALEANLIAVRLGQNQAERLDDCMKLVKDAISNVRHLSQLLRPSILDDFGLNAGLAWLAEGFEQRTGIKVDYDSSFNGRLADEAETHLFRIAQEALTNVARHANASRVQIELIGSEMQVLLRISDNGNGLTASKQRSGMGLIGMRARARTFGGEFNINTKPGKGCEIQVMVPLEGTNLAKENSNPVG